MRLAWAVNIVAVVCLALLPSPAMAEDPLTPTDGVIKLFNGRDLTGLYHHFKDSGYDDPKKVFTVHDGILHISGASDGYVGTEKSYRDYHLVVEYRWGKETFGAKSVRNSGILMHGTGADGSAEGVWITSIECQVAQGCVGDFIVIRGKDEQGGKIPSTLTSETTIASDGNTRWKKGGQPVSYKGKQFWWSLHEPGFKEEIDTRGKDDLESPLGQWTRIDCICRGDRITAVVNGVTVNECYNCFPTAGKILLESEGFELDVRTFELHPLENDNK